MQTPSSKSDKTDESKHDEYQSCTGADPSNDRSQFSMI
jgi:hypothetical protein